MNNIINYKHFNKYNTLMAEFNDEVQVIKALNDTIKYFSINIDVFNNCKAIEYNESNIRNYIDCLQCLEYNNLDKFIDHIVCEYVTDQYVFLDKIYNYEIVQDRINECCFDYRNNINSKKLKYIVKYVKIVKLHCCGSLRNEDIVDLMDLNYINICGNKFITIDGLKKLKNLIHLNMNDLITDKCLQLLPQLTHIDLNENITKKGLKYLPNLTYLHCRMNDKIRNNSLVKLKKLTDLNLGCRTTYNIDDDGLKQLNNLTHLNLEDNIDISDKGISNLINLKELHLAFDNDKKTNINITNDGLIKLTNLNVLSIYDAPNITDYGFKHLINLTELNINFNQTITDEVFIYLPKLKILNVCETNITDNGIEHLTDLIELSCNDKITNKCLIKLVNIQQLVLYDNGNVTHKALNLLPYLNCLSIYDHNNISKIKKHKLSNVNNIKIYRW